MSDDPHTRPRPPPIVAFLCFLFYFHVYSLFIGMLKHMNWRQQLLHHVPPLGFPLLIKGTVLTFLLALSVVLSWYVFGAYQCQTCQKESEFIIYFLAFPFLGLFCGTQKAGYATPFVLNKLLCCFSSQWQLALALAVLLL